MHFIKQLVKSLPFQLISLILLVFIFGDFAPVVLKQVAYTLSVFIKDLLVLALPFVIFAYLFSTLVALQNGAILFVLTLVLSVVAINFLGLNVAYFAGKILTSASGLTPATNDAAKELTTIWTLYVPGFLKAILQNENGLILGVLGGVGLGYFKVSGLENLADTLKSAASFILNKMFIPIVPLFILGFVVKMQHEGTLTYVLKQYGPVYLMILSVQLTHLMLLLFFGAKFNPMQWLQYVRNLLSPAIAGITTMSSAAALPFSLKAAEKNTGSPLIARSVIPSTVNINLMGDSIGVPFMILATMITFGVGVPSYSDFFLFAAQYVMYMFTVAAIPGGTIIIMTPLIAEQLGFSGEMISLVTALYILYDAMGTTMNVVGNGVFVVLYNRVFGRLFANDKTA